MNHYKDEGNRYLIYVTRCNIFRGKNDPEFKTDVYDYTGDVFHAMGEIIFRSEIEIRRITFAKWSPEKEKFWIDSGVKICSWRNKY